MTHRKIRVGLVGIGNWARYGHIPALRLLPEYEIVAVSSRNAQRAKQLATEYGIPNHFSAVSDLVAHRGVDLVAVLSPAPEHAVAVETAIHEGKHVYCEWPLTPSLEASAELLSLARSNAVGHCLGLQRTVGSSARYLRDLIAGGTVGQVRSVRMHVSVGSFGPTRSYGLEWTLAAKNFSHVLSIYGGHFMHMLFSVVGLPATISAITQTQFPTLTLTSTGESFPNETADEILVQGLLEEGALFQIQIEGGKHNPSGVELDITGTEGDLRVRNTKAFAATEEDSIEVATGGSSWIPLQIPASYQTIPRSTLDISVQDLAHLYRGFAQELNGSAKRVPDFCDGVCLHRIIDSIERSSRNGQRIAMGEAA
jgi:predicted dehydrogenase